MSEITSDIQKAEVDTIITLWDLDLTMFDNDTIFRFCNTTDSGGLAIEYDGEVYVPIPVDSDGFEQGGSGPLPTPTITISNINATLRSYLSQYRDILGAKVTRTRILAKFLDNGSEPDPLKIFPQDIFFINKKSADNRVLVSFELASSLDQRGVQVPGRRIFKNYCSHTYRRWLEDIGDFDESGHTCPYEGDLYFDTNGNSVDPEDDACARHLEACKMRFGANKVDLPYLGFPGTGVVY